ncbi:MAG: hypothetical protein AAB295_02965, partial [Chloroflexota bacterium]
GGSDDDDDDDDDDRSGYRDEGPRFRGNGHDDDEGYDGHHGGRHERKDHHKGDGDDDDYGTDGMRDAIAVRLARNPNYDFTALAAYLGRENGGGYGAMTPEQIARQWQAVQNCVGSLAKADDDDDDCGGGHGGHGGWGCEDDRRGHGWGHAGSTGKQRGWGDMEALSGLGEGFRKL